jgi:hypothetical protein
MLNSGILNPHVLSLPARVRHTNTPVIADRGFSFWPRIETVDLSFHDDVPTVLKVLKGIPARGVRVNSPTPASSPRSRIAASFFTRTARRRRVPGATLGHTPMGRFGENAELVGSAVFLTSGQASSFATGIDLRVDGGFLSQTI